MCLILSNTYRGPCLQSKLRSKSKYYFKAYFNESSVRSEELEVSPIYFSSRVILANKKNRIKSDRVLKRLSSYEMSECEVHHGIHVLNSLDEARQFIRGRIGMIVFKVKGHDLVAENYDNTQSVFMSITPVSVELVTDMSGRIRPIPKYVHKLLTI